MKQEEGFEGLAGVLAIRCWPVGWRDRCGGNRDGARSPWAGVLNGLFRIYSIGVNMGYC